MAFNIYILSNKENTKFIIGFTNNLVKTIHEMKYMQSGIFATEQVNKLVYFESHQIYEEAKRREREVLSWADEYTRVIISLQNARFDDLYDKIF